MKETSEIRRLRMQYEAALKAYREAIDKIFPVDSKVTVILQANQFNPSHATVMNSDHANPGCVRVRLDSNFRFTRDVPIRDVNQ